MIIPKTSWAAGCCFGLGDYCFARGIRRFAEKARTKILHQRQDVACAAGSVSLLGGSVCVKSIIWIVAIASLLRPGEVRRQLPSPQPSVLGVWKVLVVAFKICVVPITSSLLLLGLMIAIIRVIGDESNTLFARRSLALRYPNESIL